MSTTQPPRHSLTDPMDPARANALLTTLGRPAAIRPGDPLPPFFHQIHFWDPKPAGELGRDGHPKVGGLIPDTGLPRRMWAGGRLRFETPLKAGIEARKDTEVEKVAHKNGRTGPLAFVTLRHDISQDGTLCLSEWQDLVYREDPDPSAPRPAPPVAPTDEVEAFSMSFTSTMLFRYSALTFNGHRIHYDEAYSREVEGYEGLVVHGPLMAQLLMLMAQEELGPLAGFSFRGTAPLVHTETAEFCRAGNRMWVRGPDGRQCMEATAEPA